MANEKIMNTRIQLKYDSFSNWQNSSVILKVGEIAIAYLGETVSEKIKGENRPVLFKVGDGVKTFANLPWASALAADVYDWAKKETPDWNDFATIPVAKLPEEALIGDNNTTYAFAIVEGKLQVTETPHSNGVAGTPVVTTYDFVTPTELASALENYYTKDEVDDLIEGVEAKIPTSLGVMTVSGKEAIKTSGDSDVEVSLALDNSGNVALSQSASGLKAEIDLSEYAKTAELPEVPNISITDDNEAEVPTENTVNVYKNLTANGHVLTEELVQVPTVAGVDASIAANDIFETDILTVDKFGGIAAGANLNGLTTHEILNQLLYPYIAFTINSTSRNAAAATLENGASQTLNSASISITKKSKPITSVKLLNGSTVLGEKTGSDVAGGGTITFSDLDITVTKSNNPNLKFTVTDGTTSTDKNVGASTFVYPYYMGECAANATIDEALVEGLTQKVESKGNKTVTHSGNNVRMIIAYPKAHGVLKSILDPNNFETIGDYTRSEISITGLDGTAQAYYVYASGAATVNGFKVQYKY